MPGLDIFVQSETEVICKYYFVFFSFTENNVSANTGSLGEGSKYISVFVSYSVIQNSSNWMQVTALPRNIFLLYLLQNTYSHAPFMFYYLRMSLGHFSH